MKKIETQDNSNDSYYIHFKTLHTITAAPFFCLPLCILSALIFDFKVEYIYILLIFFESKFHL